MLSVLEVCSIRSGKSENALRGQGGVENVGSFLRNLLKAGPLVAGDKMETLPAETHAPFPAPGHFTLSDVTQVALPHQPQHV